MNNGTEFRLIESPALSGPENMALDEALLDSVRSTGSKPVLRLYRWHSPTLSLGYSQPVEDVDQAALIQRGWGLVRRPTGGRAILHSDELTYAVILPLSHPLAAGGVLASYQRLSLGLTQALELLGLTVMIEREKGLDAESRRNPVCFENPSAYELTVQGKKLIGSAQVRRQQAMLQHGTLPLTGDLGRICNVLQFSNENERERARTRLESQAGTVQTLLGHEVSWTQASRAIRQGFMQAFDLRLEESHPTEQEHQRRQELVRSRYDNPAWTERL